MINGDNNVCNALMLQSIADEPKWLKQNPITINAILSKVVVALVALTPGLLCLLKFVAKILLLSLVILLNNAYALTRGKGK